MLGYQAVIESMLGAGVGGENELQKGSLEESYPFRARQVAQGMLRGFAENDHFPPRPLIHPASTIFTWAVENNKKWYCTSIIRAQGHHNEPRGEEHMGSISGAAREGHKPLVALWLSEDPLKLYYKSAFLEATHKGHLETVNLFFGEGLPSGYNKPERVMLLL